MKLRQVKISNLTSFPYVKNLDDFPGIVFPAHENASDVNILIGANGSGKSNFVEVLVQFVQNLVLDYSFNPKILEEGDRVHYHEAIKLLPKKASKLTKHNSNPHLPTQVEITLDLFDSDFKSIEFVCKHTDTINQILDKYSTLSYRFPKFSLEDFRDQVKTITFRAEFSEKDQTFTVDRDRLSPEEFFTLVCLQEQELLYICTRIFNEFENKNWEIIGFPYRHVFPILSSHRDLIDWQYLNSGRAFDAFIFQENEEKNQILKGFYKVLYKVRMIINGMNPQELLHPQFNNINKQIETRLKSSPYRQELNATVQRFIGKELTVEYIQGELFMRLKSRNGNDMYFSELSAGQQSILVILFAIYGSDLNNGFLIIDEPELHLHPQLQKELTTLLNTMSKEKNIQCILSTYSALFINDENIHNVYRFQKKDEPNFNGTFVYNPRLQIAKDDAKLIHLLKYENISKIFFVNKIILVEGDSDLYFFSHYLQRLQEQPGRKDIIGTYEFININGKGSYKVRSRFLSKFWIDNYFIGDRDNTIDYGFFTSKEINKYHQLANKSLKNYQGKGEWGDFYNKLVFAIKKYNPKKYYEILKSIEQLYPEHIFILKAGTIESYPWLEKKGLQYMVNFANYEFNQRLENPKFLPQRQELQEIFWWIFGKINSSSNTKSKP